MRARGAKVTDIVILVVAADDGVMPQTIEAITHAQGGEGPDHRRGQQDRQAGRQPRPREAASSPSTASSPEEWGGDTIMVPVSARTNGEGIDQLLETCSSRPRCSSSRRTRRRRAEGAIIEAKLDKGRGPVAHRPRAGRHAARGRLRRRRQALRARSAR